MISTERVSQNKARLIRTADRHRLVPTPTPVRSDPPQERLAKMVPKLEREVYQTKRPLHLAKRDVFLRIGEPIDVRSSRRAYLQDPQTVCRRVAEQLRDTIQALINPIGASPANEPG
jgi:hypothetical protein